VFTCHSLRKSFNEIIRVCFIAFGESFLKRMSRFYPAIEHALNRVRFWASTLEIQWALAGLRSGDRS
jgi:hypothetical protein